MDRRNRRRHRDRIALLVSNERKIDDDLYGIDVNSNIKYTSFLEMDEQCLLRNRRTNIRSTKICMKLRMNKMKTI
jgi:hypothetical protein